MWASILVKISEKEHYFLLRRNLYSYNYIFFGFLLNNKSVTNLFLSSLDIFKQTSFSILIKTCGVISFLYKIAILSSLIIAAKLIMIRVIRSPRSIAIQFTFFIKASLNYFILLKDYPRPIESTFRYIAIEAASIFSFISNCEMQVRKECAAGKVVKMKINFLLDVNDFRNGVSNVAGFLLNIFNRYALVVSIHLPDFEMVVILKSYSHYLLIAEHPAPQHVAIADNCKPIDIIPYEIGIYDSPILQNHQSKPFCFIIFPKSNVGIKIAGLLNAEAILLIGIVELPEVYGINEMDDVHFFLVGHESNKL